MSSGTSSMPEGYGPWLAGLKAKIREVRLRAALSVNAELIGLYWRIGREILDHQERDGWGTKVVDRLAVDLRAEFAGMRYDRCAHTFFSAITIAATFTFRLNQ